MTPIDIFLTSFLMVIALAVSLLAIMRNEFAGVYRLLMWSGGQLDSFTERGRTTTFEKEKKAIQETLNVCEKLKKSGLDKWDIKTETFSLVEKIASIYHTDAKVPLEQARLGDVIEALKEANRKVLNIIQLPRIDYITQFRVIQALENLNTSSNVKNGDRQCRSGMFCRLLRPFFKMWQKLVVGLLQIQWLLLVGEAAIKIYGVSSRDEDVEAEAILAEWENLEDEPEAPLPENVKQIAESSKKEILFSAKSISWEKVRQIYIALTEKIARHYHSDSSYPIYEVRVCDLLRSISDSLEAIGSLGQKPVLNKILKIRISQLTQAKDMALPLGENKIFEWANKYQVGRVAKWSHSFYKSLQKKQPGILLRDVVFGLLKEGGKRWLVLFLHGKIADEANKLYRR